MALAPVMMVRLQTSHNQCLDHLMAGVNVPSFMYRAADMLARVGLLPSKDLRGISLLHKQMAN